MWRINHDCVKTDFNVFAEFHSMLMGIKFVINPLHYKSGALCERAAYGPQSL